MIRLKDLLNEKVTDVRWLEKAYNLGLAMRKFPITPKIAGILNKNKRIRAFHITSVNKLDQLNNLQGSKKTISCMTRVPRNIFMGDRIKGIWQSGVIFYLEGNLMLHGGKDIMSEPDEQGRRWVYLPNNLDRMWNKIIDKDALLSNVEDEIDTYTVNKLLYRYIEFAEKFAKEHAKDIVYEFGNITTNGMLSYDEVLLNDIELIDAIWDNKSGPDVMPITNDDTKNQINNKLKSITSGKVVIPTTYKDSDGLEFVNSRKIKYD